MKLHEYKNDFKDAILMTAQKLNIRDVYVEKDYWVTFVLFRLSRHEDFQKLFFKGGTSDFPDDLARYDLDKFEVLVLGLEKTYAEKYCSLIRHSYLGEQSLRQKIRHLYDLARMRETADIQAFCEDKALVQSTIRAVVESDRQNKHFNTEWLSKSL